MYARNSTIHYTSQLVSCSQSCDPHTRPWRYATLIDPATSPSVPRRRSACWRPQYPQTRRTHRMRPCPRSAGGWRGRAGCPGSGRSCSGPRHPGSAGGTARGPEISTKRQDINIDQSMANIHTGFHMRLGAEAHLLVPDGIPVDLLEPLVLHQLGRATLRTCTMHHIQSMRVRS